jgi:hypothetical protein
VSHVWRRHRGLAGVEPKARHGGLFAMRFSPSTLAQDGERGLGRLVRWRCKRSARGGRAWGMYTYKEKWRDAYSVASCITLVHNFIVSNSC